MADIESVVSRFAADVKELASEVHLAELTTAVRHGDAKAVACWGEKCAPGVLDRRCSRHWGGFFAVCATPLWLACYRGDNELAATLLRHGADANAISTACAGSGRTCEVSGLAALHVAVSRNTRMPSVYGTLLALGAAPDLPMCFAVDTVDEPEWNEETNSFESGLVGLSALQVAAARSKVDVCATLLANGADSTQV